MLLDMCKSNRMLILNDVEMINTMDQCNSETNLLLIVQLYCYNL